MYFPLRMRRVALFYIFALTEDIWILLFSCAFRLLQCYKSHGLWKTLCIHEKMRVKKANKSLYHYENSFDLTDPLKKCEGPLWVLGLYFENC